MRLAGPARVFLAVLLVAGASLAPAHAGGDAHAGLVRPQMPAVGPARLVRTTQPPDTAPLQIHLAELTPNVASPQRPVTMTVRITNTGPTAVRGVALRIRQGDRALRTRPEVGRWEAEGTAPGGLRTMLEQRIPGSLAPGSTAALSVVLPPGPLPVDPYGAAPLELQTRLGELTAQRRTFLPYFRIKEYTPLEIAFAAPLTGDANPSLYSTNTTERTAAWTRLLGPNGRLTRLLDGTANAPVTWAVDPALAGSLTEAAPERGSSPSPATTATATFERLPEAPGVQRLQEDLLNRLEATRATHPIWQLPVGDPDLSALVTRAHAEPLLHRLAATGANPLTGDAPSVALPATRLDDAARASIWAAYGDTPPAALLAPVDSFDSGPGVQASIPHRDSFGRLLLGYDDELSRLWGALDERLSATETTQRFLAESAALLAQSPSRQRSVLVVAPRLLDVDPATHDAFFRAVRATPWLTPTAAGNYLHPTNDATAVATDLAQAGRPQPTSETASSGSPVGAPGPPDTPLTGPDVSLIDEQHRDLLGIVSILTQPDATVRTLLAGADALAATAWRYNSSGWATLREEQARAVRDLTDGVSVRSSAVNFFADSGVLQVTVFNDLDQDVRGLTLMLNPEGRASRLRILSQPEPLQIHKRSRTTVRATVEAIAAGVVPVSTRLTTPTGTTLGTDATVRVTVQPTNGWAVLAVGGLVGMVFLAGLYRSLRGGKPRMTSEELNRIDLT